jgi:hypothetical protein
MPYEIKKKGSGYEVSGPHGPKEKRPTSKSKAVRQFRLLEAIEHDPSFKPHRRARRHRLT